MLSFRSTVCVLLLTKWRGLRDASRVLNSLQASRDFNLTLLQAIHHSLYRSKLSLFSAKWLPSMDLQILAFGQPISERLCC